MTPQPAPSTTRWRPISGWGVGLLAFVAGSAVQLQQTGLWPGWVYVWGALDAFLLLWAALLWVRPGRWRTAAIASALLVLGFSLAGARASHQWAQRLSPALEGQDLTVTG